MRDQLRQRVLAAIEEHTTEIIETGDQIHQHPEIAYQERFASALLTEAMRQHDFAVESAVGGVETAFRASKRGKEAGPTIAVLAEYDALPGIGHGCAHNLIAASGLAAAVGLGAVMERLDGTFQVIGTPAEEGGGGKIALIDAGIFADLDAALMVHHAGNRTHSGTQYPGDTCLAVAHLDFEFHGKAAHAAGDPEKGANALNGVIHLFTGIDALRQHVRPEARLHGIITHGGDAPNVVPTYAAASFLLRAPELAYVGELEEKVRAIAQGAALMTGTQVTITRSAPTYADMRPSYVLGRRYEEHMRAVGLEVTPPAHTGPSPYSTDFGNVSYLLPAATGSFAISHESIPGHSPQVVEAACSEYGRTQMLKVSQAMALTALDLFVEPALLAEAKEEQAHWSERYQQGTR
jgi:amidohydrolase